MMRCECRGRGFIARQHRTVRSTVSYGIPIKHFLLLHAGPYYCSTYLRTISIKINSDVSTVVIFYHMYIRCWHLYLVSYGVSHNFDLQEIVFRFFFQNFFHHHGDGVMRHFQNFFIDIFFSVSVIYFILVSWLMHWHCLISLLLFIVLFEKVIFLPPLILFLSLLS